MPCFLAGLKQHRWSGRLHCPEEGFGGRLKAISRIQSRRFHTRISRAQAALIRSTNLILIAGRSVKALQIDSQLSSVATNSSPYHY